MPALQPQIRSPEPRSFALRAACCVAASVCVFMSGCQINQDKFIRRAAAISRLGNGSIVEVTPVDEDNIFSPIARYLSGPATPSERTVRLLRNYNLDERLKSDPESVINWLQELVEESPQLDQVHALAEVCKLQADWARNSGKPNKAAGLYVTAIIHSHQFLFDSNLNLKRNAYDPQFRHICDVYNESLASILRQICSEGKLLPGHSIKFGDDVLGCEMEFQIVGRWKQQQFESFELVSDYETAGIDNQYRTYGLGVPLIAVCKKDDVNSKENKYYPPSLTLPLTAFCEIENVIDPTYDGSTKGNKKGDARVHHKAILKLYDPLEQTHVQHRSVSVPLESDLTTPLAYHLNDPLLNSGLLATATLLNGELADGIHGMYMLSPFDPTKIPVVMVHGIWSSPVTWAHMFNDLRAIPEIHENYQFWFYAYPTGQPFWLSAQQMREDLETIRRELDPGNDAAPLDEMVLIGHSMGGLVSQLQVMNSGDTFWNELVSDKPFGDLRGDAESVDRLRDTFFFEANESIDRVVMIGTPNRGSTSANATTRWVGQKLFTLPAAFTDDFRKLVNKNPDVLGDGTILTTTTSVDALAADSPIFEVMESAPRPNHIKFHNIIGNVPRKGLLRRHSAEGSGDDGVVSIESARSKYADSEIIVPAEHSKIHQHPSCILEVRKILTENLVEKNRIRSRRFPAIPASWKQPVERTP